MNLIKEFIDEDSSCQIVITGAGFNPLSIDCKVTFHESKVFDIDINCMNTKRKLLDSIGKQALREIALVEADLENLQEVARKLSLNGWDKNRPTIAIFEGISYYISRKALRDLITLFSSGNSYIIIEYLKTDSEIDPTRRHIPMGVFNRIMQSCSLDSVERYTIDELTKIPGVNLIRKLTMEDVEKSRTGKNKYFQSSNSGWIEIAVFST
ncbi:MAG: class I SAM-dependent methyltransferase [Chloroflexi bacterium]|nr:class I SAM-dependent methyltransferase [Chloroflexota bacterium]